MHTRKSLRLLAPALIAAASSVHAVDRIKADNTIPLNLADSWAGGVVPEAGDFAVWDNTVTTSRTAPLEDFLTLAGIKLGGATGTQAIADASGGFLVIGAGGIDFTGAKTGATATTGSGIAISTEVDLELDSSQTWHIVNSFTDSAGAAGSNSDDLIFNAQVGGRVFNMNGATVNKTGDGAVYFATGYNLTGGISGEPDETGTFNVNEGTLGLVGGSNRSVIVNSNVTMNIASGATLHIAANTGGASLFHQVTNLATGSTMRFSGGGTNALGTVNRTGAATDVATIGGAGILTTIASLSGTGGLLYTGSSANTVTLTGENAGFSGQTQIGANGVVRAGTDTSFGSGDIVFTGNGTLGSSNGARSIATPITVDAGATGSFNGSLGDLTITGSITGSGNVGVTGGNVILSGANSYTGTTTVTGGFLTVTGTGSLGGDQITINTNGTLIPTGAYADAAAWLASGKIASSSSGSLAITGDSADNINFTGFNSLGLSSTGTATYSGTITPGTGGYRFGGDASTALTVSSVLGGSSALTKTGAGSLTLTGNNTKSGGITLSGGSVFIGHDNAFGTGTINLASSGLIVASMDTEARTIANALSYSQNTVFGTSTTGDLRFTGAVALGTANNAKTITIANGVTEFSGALSGSSNTFTKLGTGKLLLSGINTHTKATVVSAGTIHYAKRAALYNGTPASWTAANFTVANGASAIFNVGGAGEFTSSDIATIAALGTATNGFLTGSRLGLDTSNGDLSLDSPIGNPNGGANTMRITKFGTGTLTLATANTYTGTTLHLGGTLAAGNDAAFGTGLLDFGIYGVTPGGTVRAADATARVLPNNISLSEGTATFGSATTGDLKFTGTLALGSANVAKGIVVDNAVTEFAGPVTGASNVLTKSGSGKLVFSGTNTDTYNKSTTVSQGTLSFKQPYFSSAATVRVAGGASLELDFTGTDTIDLLYLGNTGMAPGEYGAVGSPAPIIGTPFITGSGTLTVTSTPPSTGGAFGNWMSTNYPELTGNDALAGADPDGDGVTNLEEFAFSGDPTSGSDQGPRRFAIDTVGATDHLTLTMAVRAGAVFDGSGPLTESIDGVDYTIRGSTDLANFTLGLSEVIPAITTGLPDPAPAGFAWRTFRLTDAVTGQPKAFLHARSVATP